MSQLQASSNPELYQVLEDVRNLHLHIQLRTPLLMDEKIHYNICHLLYSSSSRSAM